jgi:DNA-binding MarR family transcriptional regulator
MAAPSHHPLTATALIDTWLETWLQAARFRRLLELELRPHSLSFPLWWVLHTTEQLIHETGDAVSQHDVALRTELDKNTLSYLMGVLADRTLVDRGPDAFDRRYRIWLTKKGERLLTESRTAVERAAQLATERTR